MEQAVIWILGIIAFIILEAVTYQLVSIWFAIAVNMPGFASPIVKKGEKYDTTTSYKFMTV